jgi:hypothetical protein
MKQQETNKSSETEESKSRLPAESKKVTNREVNTDGIIKHVPDNGGASSSPPWGQKRAP